MAEIVLNGQQHYSIADTKYLLEPSIEQCMSSMLSENITCPSPQIENRLTNCAVDYIGVNVNPKEASLLEWEPLFTFYDSRNGLSAIHLAAKAGRADVVEELLHRDVSVDEPTKKGNTALHIGALAGHLPVVRTLINNGADVNSQSQHGFTALYMAAQEDHEEMVEYLLECGADQNLRTKDGFTPLDVAMQQGHKEIVTLLLKKEKEKAPSNINEGKWMPSLHRAGRNDDDSAISQILLEENTFVDEEMRSGFTALHVAAHYGSMKAAAVLLESGANVNFPAKNGITASHIAARLGRVNIIQLLITHGCKLDARNRDGLTALHYAARGGHSEVVEILLQNGASVNAATKNGLSALHMAIQGNHLECCRLLVSHGADLQSQSYEFLTPLHVAAHCGNVEIAALLISEKINLEPRTKNGFTPLHVAVKKRRAKIVELLLQSGSDVHAVTEAAFSCLHIAAFMGYTLLLQGLLSFSAKLDEVSLRGETSLHMAARGQHPQTMEILLIHGATVDAKTEDGLTALHISSSMENVECVQVLLNFGADVFVVTKEANTPLHLAAKENRVKTLLLLLKRGGDLESRNKAGLTPFAVAVKHGQTLAVDVMLQQRSDPIFINDSSPTLGICPLHLAVHFRHKLVLSLLLNVGADIMQTTANGQNALHIAANRGYVEMADMLLQFVKSDHSVLYKMLHTTTARGRTPLHLSVLKNHETMCQLLLKHGADPRITDKQGLKPSDMANRFSFTPLYELLLQRETDMDAKMATLSSFPSQGDFRNTFTMDQYIQTELDNLPDSCSLSFVESNNNIQVQMEYLPDSSSTTKYETHTSIPEEGLLSKTDFITSEVQSQQRDHLTPGEFELNLEKENLSSVKEMGVWDLEMIPQELNTIHKGSGFLVSFVVDAQGGVLHSRRQSDLRIFVPPNAVSSPTRIMCRMVKPQRLSKPLLLQDGNGFACRLLEMGPSQMHFQRPILLEIPHFASLRAGERELIILRSDNGETWKEHTMEATEEAVKSSITNTLGVTLSTNVEMEERRIIRILTVDLPTYYAVITRLRQDCMFIGKEGDMIHSSVVNQVQAIFPEGALQKRIRVGLQAQAISLDLIDYTLEDVGLVKQIRFTPIVTVEPRRRKFHRPITLIIPLLGRDFNQSRYDDISRESSHKKRQGGSTKSSTSIVVSSTTPKMYTTVTSGKQEGKILRLFCSITGGHNPAQWEDITGSTVLSRVRDCISFTTTVSARFWIIECPNEVCVNLIDLVSRIYFQSNYIPYLGYLAVYARRDFRTASMQFKKHVKREDNISDTETKTTDLRAIFIIDDSPEKTLEYQQNFTLVATGPVSEVINGQIHMMELLPYPEVHGDELHPLNEMSVLSYIEQKAEQSSGHKTIFPLNVNVFNDIRSATIKVIGEHGKIALWSPSFDVSKADGGRWGLMPVAIVDVHLCSSEESTPRPIRREERLPVLIECDDVDTLIVNEMDFTTVSNLLGDDWVSLARELCISPKMIHSLQNSEESPTQANNALTMLHIWQQEASGVVSGSELARCLRNIGRMDIVHQCINKTAEEEHLVQKTREIPMMRRPRKKLADKNKKSSLEEENDADISLHESDQALTTEILRVSKEENEEEHEDENVSTAADVVTSSGDDLEKLRNDVYMERRRARHAAFIKSSSPAVEVPVEHAASEKDEEPLEAATYRETVSSAAPSGLLLEEEPFIERIVSKEGNVQSTCWIPEDSADEKDENSPIEVDKWPVLRSNTTPTRSIQSRDSRDVHEIFEGSPEEKTVVEEKEELLPDGSILKQRIIHKELSQVITERDYKEHDDNDPPEVDIDEGVGVTFDAGTSRSGSLYQYSSIGRGSHTGSIGTDQPQILLAAYFREPIDLMTGNSSAILSSHSVEADDPEEEVDVQEVEETLPDGTVVQRLITTRKIKQTIVQKYVVEEDLESEDEPSDYEEEGELWLDEFCGDESFQLEEPTQSPDQ